MTSCLRNHVDSVQLLLLRVTSSGHCPSLVGRIREETQGGGLPNDICPLNDSGLPNDSGLLHDGDLLGVDLAASRETAEVDPAGKLASPKVHPVPPGLLAALS